MKALSVRAPWWWAILHGKPVENRDWPTKLRGRVWLHAGKWWNAEEVQSDLEDIACMAEGDDLEMPTPDLDAIRDAGGCIVGSVEIFDCVTDSLSEFFVGDYGFLLRDPIALPKPIPFKGALGFFEVPDNVHVCEYQAFTGDTERRCAICQKLM